MTGRSQHRMSGKPTRKKNNEGFTLIELMIATVVVAIGLIGVIAFFNLSLQSNFDAKNELIAAGLVQEGAELVRNLRDYKVLNNTGWDILVDGANGLPACTRIDYDSLYDSHTCDNSKSTEICLDANNRYKQCAGGGGIGFTRTISIQCEDSGNNIIGCGTPSDVKSLRVTSKVTWNGRTTTAIDRLYQNEY